MPKKKLSFDQLAVINARLKKRGERASAKPAARSGIKGRSFAPVAPEPVEVVEPVEVETVEESED